MELSELQEVLQARALLHEGETLKERAIAGQGNMNLTVRVTSTERSFIVKQAFPYCYKFPQIPAPIKRLETEGIYYAETSEVPVLKAMSPKLYAIIPEMATLVIEDLGDGGDLTNLYDGEKISDDDLLALTRYLTELHRMSYNDLPILHNEPMRSLNHEYIFVHPFFDKEEIPGLEQEVRPLREDKQILAIVRDLGSQYLATDGPYLTQGDFYPASWMQTESGVKVIDNEFAGYGQREFDLGVILAHMIFAEQQSDVFSFISENYGNKIDWSQALQFAGIEIARRIIGVAKIRPGAELELKKHWLAKATSLIKDPEASAIL